MTEPYDPLKDPASDGYKFVGMAVDPAIENALAPEKVDWKEQPWAKFKSYAIGFGAALLVVGAIVAAIAYFAPPLAPDDAPSTMTIEPIAPTKQVIKPAIKKEAAKAVNKPVTADVGIPITDKKAVSASKAQTVDELNQELESLNRELMKGLK
jgi:hypothetical protein